MTIQHFIVKAAVLQMLKKYKKEKDIKITNISKYLFKYI